MNSSPLLSPSVFSSRLLNFSLSLPSSSSILYTLCIQGEVLTDSSSHTFARSVPVPFGYASRPIPFSILLPASLPPSYYGNDYAIIYSINITLYGNRKPVSKSVVVEVNTPSAVGERYDLSSLSVIPQSLCRVEEEGSSTALGAFVKKLRTTRSKTNTFTLSYTSLSLLLKESVLYHKNNYLNDTLLLSEITKLKQKVITSSQDHYYIRKDQSEIGILLINRQSLSIKLLKPSSHLKVSIDHREGASASKIFSYTSNITNCKSLTLTLPSTLPITLSTDKFVSSLVYTVEIDSAKAVIHPAT